MLNDYMMINPRDNVKDIMRAIIYNPEQRYRLMWLADYGFDADWYQDRTRGGNLKVTGWFLWTCHGHSEGGLSSR